MSAKVMKIVGITLSIFCLIVSPAYAYLDMGTGSYLLQVLVASALALGISVKVFWQKILTFFKKPQKKDTEISREGK
ncbi:hypothetical protein [Dethiosulfatarculus sandiegensis]|uniref:Uncharacterized protein n=1 Tax=Dethiosulfatarculus sandiegensis TaxID=1429043 RepID=A0A0D2HMF7_9BACT|nr:hypothetical protein [Dethiosulfatarculus sandiegensis]KIX11793.1 hypothetical protein X474_22215 [Dethiosulfatarculus sandiegensis]